MTQGRFFDLPQRTTPGLFITGTDTGVGKTVVTCAIADTLVRRGLRVGVCKPFASGCRTERGALVSADAEALAHFAQFDPEIGGLSVVTPIVFKEPMAPAAAMALNRTSFAPEAIARALSRLDQCCDIILVEGIGGVAVPLDPQRPQLTVLNLIREVGFPAVVVTRADLGTLNHTYLTCEALRRFECRIAGLVLNYHVADTRDMAVHTNAQWLAAMNRVPILATIPFVHRPGAVAVASGALADEVRVAVNAAEWQRFAHQPAR